MAICSRQVHADNRECEKGAVILPSGAKEPHGLQLRCRLQGISLNRVRGRPALVLAPYWLNSPLAQFAGTVEGASLFFTKKTKIFAGSVVLAFLETA
jgi:hypothetical protein